MATVRLIIDGIIQLSTHPSYVTTPVRCSGTYQHLSLFEVQMFKSIIHCFFHISLYTTNLMTKYKHDSMTHSCVFWTTTFQFELKHVVVKALRFQHTVVLLTLSTITITLLIVLTVVLFNAWHFLFRTCSLVYRKFVLQIDKHLEQSIPCAPCLKTTKLDACVT